MAAAEHEGHLSVSPPRVGWAIVDAQEVNPCVLDGPFALEVLAVTVVGLVPGVPSGRWIAGAELRDPADFVPAGIGFYGEVVAMVALAASLTMMLASRPAVRGLASGELAAVAREGAVWTRHSRHRTTASS